MASSSVYDSDKAGIHTSGSVSTCYHNHCSEDQFLLKFQSMDMAALIALRASVDACKYAFDDQCIHTFTGVHFNAFAHNQSAQEASNEDKGLLRRISKAIDGKLVQPQTRCTIS